jgi:hypothetical protein
MALTCEILVTKFNKQVLAGLVVLDGQKVSLSKVAKDYQLLMDSVLNDPIKLNGRQVTARSDPEEWFRALPSVLNGTYLRARITDAGTK